MIDTPCLVESCKNVTLNNLIANIAKVSKQLMVVGFAVGKAFSLIVTISKKRLLTLCTHKMLDMPMFPECSNNSLLDWSSAGPTDGYSHFVMTAKTVELVEFICSVAWSCPHLPGT